jgi:protein-S-isoprenylcysteine O-methyltransferase Ste14
MSLDYFKLARDLWYVLGFVWLVGLVTTKPVARVQSLASRLLHIGLTLLAFCLVFTPYFRTGWRAWSFVPNAKVGGAIGLAIVLLGICFSIWARLELGGNWSGSVTIKEGHTLIRRGPYTIVRHPIYTGLLLALLGVAVIVGELGGLLGVAVMFLSFWVKSRVEERFMLEQFGEGYRQYQQQVKGLVPYVF